ncbi:MAG TPA: hypothetical protein VHB72_01805 [Candidatus Saccharimonadales bacterium]|nr:hypothetical protein [Candidatus Saccharimonadales bacterium]
MRYFIGFLVTIGLLIILVVLLFSGGGGPNSKKPKTTKALTDYASSNAVVRMTIDGPINADTNHTAVRVTVGKDDATYQQIQGYQGTVVNTQSYANNENAYSNLLYALGHAGFTKGDNNKLLANEKGYCPLGKRYVFELLDGNNTVERYWTTSCGSAQPRTYKGNTTLTISLFEYQIPDYFTLTQSLQHLNSP